MSIKKAGRYLSGRRQGPEPHDRSVERFGSVLAGRTDTKNFEQMPVDGKLGVATEIPHQLVYRTGGERHRRAATRADKMVTVTWGADDIRRVPARLEDPGEDVDRR